MNEPITQTRLQIVAPPEASTEGTPQLVVISGSDIGRVIAFEGSCVIGRSADSSVRLDDPGLSRRQARIERVRRNTYCVEDLGSRNGTRVDGDLVERREIVSGSTIQLGRHTTLRFLVQDPLERQREETTRLDFVSRLAAGLSHDFNNVLCALTANIGYLRGLPAGMTLGHADVRECMIDLAESADAAANLVRHLTALSKDPRVGHAKVKFSELLTRTADSVQRSIPRNVQMHIRVQPALELMGDEASLEQIILAPCFNARDAMVEGGKLDIVAEVVAKEEHEAITSKIVLRISDTGTGMSREVMSRAFEPFYSTKDGARGLGLSACRKAAQEHGGTVTLQSEPGKGSMVTIELPALEQAAAEDVRVTLSSNEALRAERKAHVLIADDEDAVARALARVLTRAGHLVTVTRDGQEALDAYLADPGEFDVVLLDMDMPRMNGSACFSKLRAADPNVQVVLMSGLGHRDASLAEGLAKAHAFLHKPVEPQVLVRTIAEAIAARPDLRDSN